MPDDLRSLSDQRLELELKIRLFSVYKAGYELWRREAGYELWRREAQPEDLPDPEFPAHLIVSAELGETPVTRLVDSWETMVRESIAAMEREKNEGDG